MQISVSNVFFAALGAAFLAALVIFGPPTTAPERPNVLIIMIDTVRADHLGAYGYDKPTSPFLDSLFAKGTLFEHAYAPAYLTFQTDASVLSGLYPSQNNVRTWTTPVRDDIRLLPEVFKLYGYETHMLTWSGLRDYFGLGRGFDTYTIYRGGDLFSKTSADVLDKIRSHSKPFFIYWTIYDVHVPMPFASPDFAPEGYDGPFSRERTFLWPEQSTKGISYLGANDRVVTHTKTDADRAYVNAQYDTAIRNVDDGLARVFAELEASGKLANTIVVVSAQHGEDLGEHGFFFHRDVYENGIRVPLAIIYPPSVKSQRVDTPVTLIDLAPTLTELAGVPRFEGGEGISLVPAVSGRTVPHRTIFAERQPFREFAVINWPWKLIVRDSTQGTDGISNEPINNFLRALRRNDVALSNELYQLETDPHEQENLYGTEAASSVQSALMESAQQFRAQQLSNEERHRTIEEIHDDRILFSYP